jgi:hypothetical protein
MLTVTAGQLAAFAHTIGHLRRGSVSAAEPAGATLDDTTDQVAEALGQNEVTAPPRSGDRGTPRHRRAE